MSPPFSLFVILVQQEGFQPWTVYRRYCHFRALYEQIQNFPDIPVLPVVIHNKLHIENALDLNFLEQCLAVLDKWLLAILSNPLILRTQSMYHFLCADANISPPYLEIHWKCAPEEAQEVEEYEEAADEMEMDDMFGHGK